MKAFLLHETCLKKTSLIALLTHHKTQFIQPRQKNEVTLNKTIFVSLSCSCSNNHQLWFDSNKSLVYQVKNVKMILLWVGAYCTTEWEWIAVQRLLLCRTLNYQIKQQNSPKYKADSCYICPFAQPLSPQSILSPCSSQCHLFLGRIWEPVQTKVHQAYCHSLLLNKCSFLLMECQ